jgi:ADP-ribose pyrophosphatase YjhB (NUDIX family)
VIEHEDRVLLCRRAIEPRHGFWTLPAGFMELGETVQEGAQREAREEAEADIALDGILGVYSISRIGQVHIFFRARFADPAAPHFVAGEETLEAGLFAWDDIAWGSLAFPTVRWALDAWQASAGAPLGAPTVNPAADQRGVHRIRGGV